MKILFMSLSNYHTIYVHGLYSDLLRQFIEHGNDVYVVAPFERNSDEKERVVCENGATIVKLKIWNMQKVNIIEKGISMLTIESIFIKGIKTYFSDIKFNLVLYTTPPITLLKVVEFVKKRDGATTYLLLKDIFPQNAVDIGLMSKKGFKGILYKYFRRQEKKLYAISDYIGCMSEANVKYVIEHNPEIDSKKIEICPNTMDPIDMSCIKEQKVKIRNEYGIPLDKTVFVYGGNLGKPQGIPFIIDCLKKCKNMKGVYFLIIGSGTEYGKLKKYINEDKPRNVKLMQQLPKEDYDKIVSSCDIGLIFLDYRFTIPNFPSRLLSYMAAKLPVLACTDPNTDIGKLIIEGKFGWWCESNDVDVFVDIINKVYCSPELKKFGNRGFQILSDNFSSAEAYKIISKSEDR